MMDSNNAADDKLQRRRHRRRRCCCVCLLVSLGAAALLGVTLLVLFLTVLRVRDPTTRLVSSRVIGFAPGPDLQFNLTMLLTVGVHNPNRASFSYESGSAELWYRGVRVGVAGVDPGRIPSRGDGTMELEMTVLSASFGAERGAAGRQREGAREGWALGRGAQAARRGLLRLPRHLRRPGDEGPEPGVPRPHQALIGSAGRLLGRPSLRLAARAMPINTYSLRSKS